MEDNAALARTMRWAVLAQCEVTAVGSAREALECLARHWDAFIFDINLPDGCGLAMMRRAREVHPTAAALVISGSERAEDIDVAHALGARFLGKPFKPVDILRFLETFLPEPDHSGPHETSREAGGDPLAPGHQDFSDPSERLEESGLIPSPFPPDIARLVAAARVSGIHAATAVSEHDYKLAILARAASTRGDFAANIDACAKALDTSRQRLQDFATLTSRWEPERVAELLSSHDRAGRAITRAILLRVARATSALRRTFDEQMHRGAVDLDVLSAELDDQKTGSRRSP